MQRFGSSIGLLVALVLLNTQAPAAAAETSAAPQGASAELRAPTPTPTPTPAPAAKADAPQPPVRISADTAEYFNKEGLVLFTGNVVAVQADSTITAERMEVSFETSARADVKPASGIGAPAAAQRITTIVAKDKVSFRQADPETGKERYATGDKGVYDVDRRLVTMSGNPRLWEGKNVIAGEEMVFDLAEKKVVVRGKVNLTVYPDELKEEKKP